MLRDAVNTNLILSIPLPSLWQHCPYCYSLRSATLISANADDGTVEEFYPQQEDSARGGGGGNLTYKRTSSRYHCPVCNIRGATCF